ncbi:hypothetical protein YC2023_047585 [Brassica napus]
MTQIFFSFYLNLESFGTLRFRTTSRFKQRPPHISALLILGHVLPSSPSRGTRVAKTPSHHRFSLPPAIQTTDRPTTPDLKSSAHLLLKPSWVSKTGEKTRDLKPATQSFGSLHPPETRADDGGTEGASPPRRQKAGGDGSEIASISRNYYSIY